MFLLWAVLAILVQGTNLTKQLPNSRIVRLHLKKDVDELHFEAHAASQACAIHFKAEAPRIIYHELPSSLTIKQGDVAVLIRSSRNQSLREIRKNIEAQSEEGFREINTLASKLFDNYQIISVTGDRHQVGMIWRLGLLECFKSFIFTLFFILIIYFFIIL